MLADALLNGALWARMQLLRWTHWTPFVNAAKHPADTQIDLLLRLLHRNRDTRFGREHAFAEIKSYADFAAAVPVQTYETLRPYIEDQEQTGEPGAQRRATRHVRADQRHDRPGQIDPSPP